MYKRFCVNCGKETKDLVDGLCRECYIKTRKQEEKEIEIKVCYICGFIIFENKKYDSKNFYKKLEKKFGGKIIKIEENIVEIKKESDDILLIKIYYRKDLCKDCKRVLNKKSYNYVIQLRGDIKKIEEIIAILNKNGYLIKNIENLDNGVDLFLDLNKKGFKTLLKKIKNYTKNIKITKKVISYDKQSNRYKYKVFISVRL